MDEQDKAQLQLSPENQRKYNGSKPRWWFDGITDDFIAWVEEISTRKQVTLFAEFGSDGLLDFKLHEIQGRYLPVDDTVLAQIDAWWKSLKRLDLSQSMSDEPVNWRPFADEGFRLAITLKQALPDWSVHYADRLMYYEAPDGGYCPEVFGDGSLGLCRIEVFKALKVKDMTPAFVWPKPPR
jgi:hypothetical protein